MMVRGAIGASVRGGFDVPVTDAGKMKMGLRDEALQQECNDKQVSQRDPAQGK